MCHNRFTIHIDLFKYKRFKDGGCPYKNTGSSHLKKPCIYFLSIMAFVTDAHGLQALLDACSSTQEWELLLDSILVPNECNVY